MNLGDKELCRYFIDEDGKKWFEILCPHCEKTEIRVDSRADITISVICVNCKRYYLAHLRELRATKGRKYKSNRIRK
jgi:hypothetical protein